MRLQTILCTDCAGLLFLADIDDMIRLPDNAGYKVVAVMFKRGVTPLFHVRPVLLTILDGTWKFEAAPPDPDRTLQAVVRLAKENLPRHEIAVCENGKTTFHVFEIREGRLEYGHWMIALHWELWNARKLLMKERKSELAEKLGCDSFARMPMTTFQSICYRKLNLAPAVRR